VKDISPRSYNFFNEQSWLAAHFLNTYIEITNSSGLNILEVGSAEGGVLSYFAEKNNRCYGLEYSRGRVEIARELNQSPKTVFIHGDITDTDTYARQINDKMDVIICCDVIEHIVSEKRSRALQNMRELLKEDGRLYISFPPKYSPFAGHQQCLPNWLRAIPYLFLWPDNVYSAILKSGGIHDNVISSMLETKKSRISVHEFEKLVRANALRILKKDYFLIRPRFKFRYGLPCLRHRCDLSIIREVFNLGSVYLLQPCAKY